MEKVVIHQSTLRNLEFLGENKGNSAPSAQRSTLTLFCLVLSSSGAISSIPRSTASMSTADHGVVKFASSESCCAQN